MRPGAQSGLWGTHGQGPAMQPGRLASALAFPRESHALKERDSARFTFSGAPCGSCHEWAGAEAGSR